MKILLYFLIGIFVLLIQLSRVLGEDVVSYANYKVYTVAEEGLSVPAMSAPGKKRMYSVLSEHKVFRGDSPVTLRSYLISEQEEKAFRRALDKSKAKYNVSVADLGKEIEEERRSNELSRRALNALGPIGQSYYSYEEMITYLMRIATILHPVTKVPLAIVEPIGRTYEGRIMYLVKISSNHDANNPILFIEAGIHAREWTAPATALYIIHQLVEKYAQNQDVIKKLDFYIIPLSNPDGYEYSRLVDRMWRKTRSFNFGYYGVDGNRNFGFHWGTGGTSNYPGSEIYIGPRAFSEFETRNIRDAGKKYASRIKMFVSLHAFGPFIVYPWSYRRLPPAPHADVMDRIAMEAGIAIWKYNGTKVIVGNSAFMLYEAAGGADDYFKGELGVDLSFTVELSANGEGSFITPTSKLFTIVAETYEGIKVMADRASKY